MTLTELSIKRPSFIIVIFTILIGGGMLSYQQLSYELMPDFAPPVLTVTTTYPGASPATVESQVSKPLEDGLSGIENLSEVTTFSLENASIILLEFKDGVDINLALQEAQRKINTIESVLPDNSTRPVLAKIEPNATPVLQVIATAKKHGGQGIHDLDGRPNSPANQTSQRSSRSASNWWRKTGNPGKCR